MLIRSSLLLLNSCLMLLLGELGVVARGQPCMLVGDFNVEPTKIPCLAKGISAGLWVDFEVSWALAAGKRPASTCKRTFSAAGGHRRGRLHGGLSPCCCCCVVLRGSA